MQITSEYVGSGHPDKIADQISDAILDEALCYDPLRAKVACETMVKGNTVCLAGEINCCQYDKLKKDYQPVIQSVMQQNGYTELENFLLIDMLSEQSEEINKALGKEQENAGDQGVMFGYACKEIENQIFMPISIMLARDLVQIPLSQSKTDKKSQVTVEYNSWGKPEKISNIVLSINHEKNIDFNKWKKDIKTSLENRYMSNPKNIFHKLFKDSTNIEINPAGPWMIGGPVADCGLTGRKIVVDSYGGHCEVGGGCFSGKDPTKVDRSGAYMARFIAKNVVANLTSVDWCKVQLSYVIGKPEPSTFQITTNRERDFNTELEKYVKENFDLTPKGIIDKFILRFNPYLPLARYGHFGFSSLDLDVNENCPWEVVENWKNLLLN